MGKVLKVNGFSFSYKDKEILNSIDLTILSGTINGVIGGNSSGKTTLIRAFVGNLTFSNDIELDNVQLIRSKRDEYLKSCDVIYLASDKKLKFNSVKLLFRYQLQSRGYNLKNANKRISEFSDRFNIKELINKKISKLSVVDKAKVLLVAAIIHKPKIVFADDLFCDLSFDECYVISEMLEEIKRMGIAVVFTTNRLDACLVCDNIYFLIDGSLDRYDSVNSLIKRDNVLSRNGIIIPPMLDLSQKLKDYDLLDEIVYTPERMVDILWK